MYEQIRLPSRFEDEEASSSSSLSEEERDGDEAQEQTITEESIIHSLLHRDTNMLKAQERSENSSNSSHQTQMPSTPKPPSYPHFLPSFLMWITTCSLFFRLGSKSYSAPFSSTRSEAPLNGGITQQDPGDQHRLLQSYTYSNCPFTLAKFSQYEMAKKSGSFRSQSDEFINSIMRAEEALKFSNDNLAYDRVFTALKKQAFNRTIVMEGDSLTRQLFISLSCLAWSAGYVNDYQLDSTITSGDTTNTILKNAHYSASSMTYGKAQVKLKGGGQIYYISHPIKEKIEQFSERMIYDACDAKPKYYEAKIRKGDTNALLTMKKDDVVLLAAGHHSERPQFLSTFKRFFKCKNAEIANNSINGKDNKLDEWPQFLYQLSSVPSFWTEDGVKSSPSLPGKEDSMSCRPNVITALQREEDRRELNGLVPFIGNFGLKNLGSLHPFHGDCLHWIQPGVPDLYAAELADFVLTLA